MTARLWIIALLVFGLNLPFGLWRSRVRKYSWPWIFAIHLPVPVIVALRIFGGIGFQFITYPVLVGAFFLGQFTGGKAGRLFTARGDSVRGRQSSN